MTRSFGYCLVTACLAAALAACGGDSGSSSGTGGRGGTDGGDVAAGSGGATGTGGSFGTGGSLGSGGPLGGGGQQGAGGAGDAADDTGTDGVDGSGDDAGDDAGSADMSESGDTDVDPATVPACDVTITENTYNVAMSGCSGIVSCRGVIGYRNNTASTLTFVVISFSIPDGTSCVKTHSTSKWIIHDDGATSHKCFFTTQPTIPWTVLPGGTFRFGYDLGPADFAATPPTDIAIHDLTCTAPDGGVDAPDGGSDADAEAPTDSSDAGSDDGGTDGGVDSEPDAGGDGQGEVEDGAVEAG